MTRRIPNPKNSAARSILRLALSYAASNPTANLPRLLRLARVAALKEGPLWPTISGGRAGAPSRRFRRPARTAGRDPLKSNGRIIKG